MRVVAVPVKSLPRAKRRLGPLLTSSQRAVLAVAMMEDVLEAAVAQPGWEVWVVSGSKEVLEVAARWGARSLPEAGSSLLAAIRQVEGDLHGPAPELAVVLGDLPLLTANGLRDALVMDAPVVASPARSDGGTNLLLRRPPHVIPARFGRSSFAKHRWAARRANARFQATSSFELGFDLDRPGDVATLLATDRPTRTRAACLEMGLPERLRARDAPLGA